MMISAKHAGSDSQAITHSSSVPIMLFRSLPKKSVPSVNLVNGAAHVCAAAEPATARTVRRAPTKCNEY